jgi:hypothetical protein
MLMHLPKAQLYHSTNQLKVCIIETVRCLTQIEQFKQNCNYFFIGTVISTSGLVYFLFIFNARHADALPKAQLYHGINQLKVFKIGIVIC